jgi:L-lactate dehydrogenase complex protein LldF
VKINIHEQIYKWRQVMAERNQLPLVKKEAIRIIGKVMSEPRLYRAAISATGLAIEHLPRFAIYNWLNPWGRQREVPESPKQSFHTWYVENRRRQ